MSERTERLRQESLAAVPAITGERAETVTAFYKEQSGKHSLPVLRGLSFLEIVKTKALWLGDGELIVGERGPSPKAVPTFPELTCHSVEDLRILDSRPLTAYKVAPGVIEAVPARHHPVLERPLHARPDVPGAAPGMDRLLRGRLLHRVHGAALPGPHGGRRQDLPQGPAGFPGRHREGHRRPGLPQGPGGPGQARGPAGHGPVLRRGDALGPALRGSGQGPGGGLPGPGAQGGAAQDRRRVHPGAGPRAPGLPGGPAVLLVLPPGGDHRAERLGRVQPRAPGPAPVALLPERAGRGHPHPGQGQGAAGVLLHQVQQPHGAGQAGGDRGRERHLHRLRQHQPGGPAAGRFGRLQRVDPPAPGDHRRDAPAAAQQQHAGLAQDPRRGAQARPAGHPQRLRIPVPVQRRRGGGGAAAPGQDPGGRPGGRQLAAAWKWGPSARRRTSSPATST